MTEEKTINDIMISSSSGVITSKEVTAAGLHRSELQKLVKTGDIYRFGKGLYVSTRVWEDDFYLLQLKYRKGVYSHDTALYLLGYSDRAPAKYTMTFPKGYNCSSIKQENILVKRVVSKNYGFGIIEAESPSGNPIRIYDSERTICDILRGNNGDIQIITSAMKRYMKSKERDIHKLLYYAEQLHVKPKVLRYLEVLL